MKKNLMYVLTFGAIAFLFSSFVVAQDNREVTAAGNLYVISANAGGVNYVEGKVAVAQKSGKSGYLLKGDALEVGDKISTGTNGKAEILLNPGSYVRLAENSYFEFTNTSLDDLQVKLNGGSAMFEVITDDEFKFVVSTPKAQFKIVRSGVYRIDVLSDGSGKIAVWKGEAEVGNGKATIVKGGREATVNQDQITVEKFKRDDKESLAAWSKTRAKELAKVNARLERNNLRNSLLNSYNRNGWNLYDSYGLWVFDRFSGNHCFLPFGYGWRSPYGFGFGRDIFYFQLPRNIYNQPPTRIRNNDTRNSDRRISPPSERIQRDFGREPVEREGGVGPSRKSNPSPQISPPSGISPQRESSPQRTPRKVNPVDN